MTTSLRPAQRGLIGICTPVFLLFLTTATLASQSLWTDLESRQLPTDGDRRTEPMVARFFSSDTDQLRDILTAAPHESTVAAEMSPVELHIPQPDGEDAYFKIVAYDISEAPALARFPQIRTWYGVNVNNSDQTIFLDWTSRGFHASVRNGKSPSYFIDPVFRGDRLLYQSYFKEDFKVAGLFTCSTEQRDNYGPELASGRNNDNCSLLQYRTAIATTAEYSNYHDAFGVDDAHLVHSAVVTTLNRVNQLTSRDLSLRLLLVANNSELYYYDVENDPYNGTSPGGLLGQNAGNVNAVIGEENYDLGHVFSAGFSSGVAFPAVTCGSLKAAGVTGRLTPEGDPFDVDYVAHEMGHQFGANHTQNNSCNYSSIAGMEPGSASTVMGYAGICTPNVQPNSDAYYHGVSIQEISNHVKSGPGNDCATIISQALTTPVLEELTNDTVPHLTPLVLSGQAQGDGNLTYCWEQWDPEQASMPPQSSSSQGPLFRSFEPTTDSFRFIPNLFDVVRKSDPMWEEIPSTERDMEFRMTVRNFNAAYSCTNDQNKKIRVKGDRGPFLVTDPSHGNQFSAGQTIQVQWDLARTNEAPISCDYVEILYSADNGLSFVSLADSVPNTGYSTVDIPETLTTDGRIMIRSIGNVFYNLSNLKFSVTENTGTPFVSIDNLTAASLTNCFTSGEGATYQFITASSGGATSPITFSASNLPGEATATFYPNPVQPGGTTRLVIGNIRNLEAGSYTVNVNGNSTEAALFSQVDFEKTGSAEVSGPTQINPVDADPGMDIRPRLSFAGNGAFFYQLQVATDPDFQNIILDRASSNTSYQFEDFLSGNTTYYWRVRSNNGSCGYSLWSERSFTTGDCYIYHSDDTPLTITTGPPPNNVSKTISVPAQGVVSDIDLYLLDVNHSWLGDLQINLKAPNNVQTMLFDRECSSSDNILISLDETAQVANLPCPPVNADLFVQPPNGNLDVFNGVEVGGAPWTLEVKDLFNRDGGSFNSFALKICIDNFAPLPVELLRFVASPVENAIQLEWATENEIDNYGFYVERSNGNGDRWNELGFVAASDQANGNYAFLDDNVAKGITYYYRLRQVDVDGTVYYSSIRSAKLDGYGETLELFPNPASNFLSYRWLMETPDETDYAIYDTRGVRIGIGRLNREPGNLDISNLPAGLYLLRLESGVVLRFVKQ